MIVLSVSELSAEFWWSVGASGSFRVTSGFFGLQETLTLDSGRHREKMKREERQRHLMKTDVRVQVKRGGVTHAIRLNR